MLMITTLLACSAFCVADDPKEKPPAVKAYFEYADRQRQTKIAEVEQDIKDRLSGAAKRKNTTQQQRKQQGAEIAAVKTELESLKKNDPPFVPTIKPSSFQVGQMGAIVLDSGAEGFVMTTPGRRTTSSAGSTATQIRVSHVESKKEMTVEPFFREGKIERIGDPFLVNGVDTTNMVDGQTISLDGIFHVSRTKSFSTVGGKFTMFVLESIDVAPWQKKTK